LFSVKTFELAVRNGTCRVVRVNITAFVAVKKVCVIAAVRGNIEALVTVKKVCVIVAVSTT